MLRFLVRESLISEREEAGWRASFQASSFSRVTHLATIGQPKHRLLGDVDEAGAEFALRSSLESNDRFGAAFPAKTTNSCHSRFTFQESTMNRIAKFLKADDAIAVTEYALLIALVAVALVAAVLAFGTSLRNWFTAKTSQITTV